MPGAGARIEIATDDRALRTALDRMISAVEYPQEAMKDISEKLRTSIIHCFETERGLGGAPWKKSGRARREGGQTLTDTGRLRGSIAAFASDIEAVVGTNVTYAAIHQFGGRTAPHTIRARDKKALAWPGARHPVQQVNHPAAQIPARPFLGIDDGDCRTILRMIEKHLREALR